MRKSAGKFLLVFFLALTSFFFHKCQQKKNLVETKLFPGVSGNISAKIQDQKAEIGSREDPQARQAYEHAIVADPGTGEIPLNIKRREYLFASKMPRKLQQHHLRTESSEASQWRSVGPYTTGGRTRALAIDITNENIILAGGVSGGMWRTEDGGDHWTKTTVPSSIHSVSCIVQDTRPGKTNIWYYGTGEFTSNSASKKNAPFRGDGVFKSVDGGKTWNQLSSTSEGFPNNYNSQFQYISKLIINKNNLVEDEVFLATVGAIFRSLDGGDNWSLALGTKLISTPDTDLNNANISDYTDIAQARDGAYYAVFSAQSRSGSSPNRGIFRSTDGIQWFSIGAPAWPRNYARTIIAPAAGNDVYFIVNSGATDKLLKYTYISGSGTQTDGVWNDLSSYLPTFGGDVGDYDSQASYNMVLEAHPENSNMIFLGGTNLYRSNDGFSSNLNTAWIGGYDTANNIKIRPNHFVDQHALAFYTSNPNKMISANDGGIFITEDNTRDIPIWRSLNNGFITTQFYTIALDEFGSYGRMIGGLQDNGSRIADRPIDLSPWNRLLSGDGGYAAITRNSSFYYASFQFGKMYRFTLNNNLQSETFTRIDPLGSGGESMLLFVNPYVLAPENQHILYFAGGDVVWRNLNTSQIPLYKNEPASINWEELSETRINSGSTITAINASYNPSGTVIYGTDAGELFRINQSNKTTYSVDDITSYLFPKNAYVSCVAFDRRDSRNLVVAFSNYNVISLFYSDDGGETFENISGNLEENLDGSGSGPSVRWVEIVSKKDGSSSYFAGTSTGVYSTNNLNGVNTTWEQEGSDVIGNVLVPMIKYSSEDGQLVVATHGNGVYRASLDNVWHTEINQTDQELSVGNPYPNPFTDHISIPFTIPDDGVVRARIYNPLGQQIKTLIWASQFKGRNVVTWDGTNDGGSKVIKGTYLCRFEYGDKVIGTQFIYVP